MIILRRKIVTTFPHIRITAWPPPGCFISTSSTSHGWKFYRTPTRATMLANGPFGKARGGGGGGKYQEHICGQSLKSPSLPSIFPHQIRSPSPPVPQRTFHSPLVPLWAAWSVFSTKRANEERL